MRTAPRFALAVVAVTWLSIGAHAAAPPQKPPSSSDARLRASVLLARSELLAKYRNAPVAQAQDAFRAFWRTYDETVLQLSSRFRSGPFEDDLLQHVSEIEPCLEQPLVVIDRSTDPRMAELGRRVALRQPPEAAYAARGTFVHESDIDALHSRARRYPWPGGGRLRRPQSKRNERLGVTRLRCACVRPQLRRGHALARGHSRRAAAGRCNRRIGT